MAEIIRHGGNAHFMRPDRVYRTSVIAPMVGYQPEADVQAVTQEFTQGPRLGMMLSGLGTPGPIQRLGLRIKAWMARKKAERFMQVSGLGMPGPVAMQAQQIAPHLAAQMARVVDLMSGRYGTGYPAVQADAIIGRTLNNRYP